MTAGTLLSPMVLNGCRRAQLGAMPAHAHRWTPTSADNGRGGRTRTLEAAPWPWPTWAAADDSVPDGWLPARLARPSDEVLTVTADRYGARPRWILTLPAGTPLSLEDVVAVADPATGVDVVGTVGELYTDPQATGVTAGRALLVADPQGRTLDTLPEAAP